LADGIGSGTPLRDDAATGTDVTLVVYDDELGMRWGPEHPYDARRHRLTVALARAAGLLDAPELRMEPAPSPLDDAALARTFAPAFVRAIRRFSADPLLASGWDARGWGVDADNGAYAGMHEDSARLAATSGAAGAAVAGGRARRAFVPTGGAHHGLANRMWGFGVYNDTAVCINAARDAGAERVAYVDLDVHHGNGTQAIFYSDPRVLTVSVHETGRHLFPGSGFPHESGGSGAEGTSVNVALPPFAGDEEIRAAFARVVDPVVRAFRPDVLVTQCGVDTHHADPLSHLRATMALYPWLWAGLRALADGLCGGRWVALAGGGYEPFRTPPRAWALLLAAQLGEERHGALPERWREEARAAGAPGEPPRGWLEDDLPAAPPGQAERAAAATAQAIDATLSAVGGYWGLA
jgi:acetoin utilization protein AcuC